MRAVEQGMTRMRDVKVKRLELLDIVRKNRGTHVTEYDEAIAGYREEALDRLASKEKEARRDLEVRLKAVRMMIEEVASRGKEELIDHRVVVLHGVSFDLPVPQNHSQDYDQVIRMLELSVDGEITIRSDEFACYVMDDWDWKADFSAVNRSYSSKL